MKNWHRWAIGVAAAVCCTTAWGQWRTQDIRLHAGWNAVAIQVKPVQANFGGLLGSHTNDVEEIWRWSKAFTAAEFSTDESKPMPKSAHWDVWVQGEESFLTTMQGFVAGQTYMVRVKEGTPDFTFSLKGRATLPRQTWYPNALNMIGGCVATNGTTFEEWFAGASPEVDLTKGYRNQAYKVKEDGKELQVSRPAQEKIAQNEAVWVFCNGALDWTGPIKVSTDCATGIGGLDFGDGRVSQLALTIENRSPNALEVELSLQDSAAAPAGAEQVAGAVPLYFQKTDESGLRYEWQSFTTAQTRLIAPNEKWTVQCGVKRTEMEYREEMSETNSAYQSLLRIRATRDLDQGGVDVQSVAGARRWDVEDILCPVRAVRSKSESLPWMLGNEDTGGVADVHAHRGLWVGEATIYSVNCPDYAQYLAVGDATLPVNEPLPMRLLVYVDGDGNVFLLQEAWIVQDTEGKAGIVICPERATAQEQARLLEQNGSGVKVSRISAAMFPQGMSALEMAHDGAESGLSGILTATVDLAYDAPTNPFMHRYHPMFDNLDSHFSETVKESKDVSRRVTMEFQGITDTRAVSGIYAESVTGLRAATLKAMGHVYLQKVLAGAELIFPASGN